MAHRIEEGAVVYGRAISFWHMNPFMFFHNTYSTSMNVALSLVGEVLLGPWRLYGEAMSDDVHLAIKGKSANPTALGFYLGGEYAFGGEKYQGHIFGPKPHVKREDSFRTENGGLTLSVQMLYAMTYLYGRSQSDPLGKITLKHNLRGLDGDKVIEYCLGTPYGPDSISLELKAHYENPVWYVTGKTAVQLQGKKGYSGYYSDKTGWQAQGLFDPLDADDWAFSGIHHVNLYVSAEVYRYLTRWCSAYAAFQSRVDILHPDEKGRFFVATGVAMRF